MNSRIYLAFLLVAFLFLAGCSQEDLLRSSMKVGCCNLNESKKGNCVLEGNDAGVSVLKTYSCDLASAGTCSAQIQYTFNILDEASKKITTITPKPEDKTIPICKVDTMDNPCIQRQCVAQVCGPFDFVPESILSYRDNIVLSQKMADGESDDEDAPSSDKSKSIKLYGTKCMNLNMDENLSRVFTNTKGSMVNIFRLGVGSSFQDFEKYRLLFPFSDLACNVYPFLSAKERYTNYFRMDYESAYANLAATFNNLTYCPTQQGKSPLRNDIYGDVKQPPNYKFENVTAIADGKVRFSFEKFDDNFYDQLLRWTDRSVLNQVTPANYPAPIQTEFECAAPSDCRSGNCDQNVYRRGMCQRDDGRWVNCECYGGGMYCAGETVIYPEPLGVKTTQDAVSKYDKGIPLYIRIQRQVAMKKIYDNPGGFLKRSYTNVYQCYFKGDGFGVDYKCFFAEDEKDKYPYADYFNCTDISDGKFDCNYLGGEYNNGARFLFYDVGTLPGLNDDDFYSPFSNKKLLSPKQNKEITCKSEADCPIGNNCNFALGKCVPAGMCADIKNIGNLGGSCKADADCPFYQKCGDSGKCEFSYCNSDAECPSNYCLNYQCSGQLNYYSPFSTSSAACSAPYSCSVQTTDANGVGIGYCRFNGDPAAVSCGNNNPFCPLGYSCDSVHQKCILDTNPQCFNAYECQTSVSIDSATYLLDCDQEEDSDGLKIPGKYLCGGATIAMDNFEPIPDAINFLQNPPNGIYFFGKSREVTEVSDDQPGSDFRIGGDEDKPPSFIGYTFLTESEFKQTNFFKTCELADKDYSVFYFEFAPLYSMSSGGGSGQILNVFMLGSFDYGIIGSTYPYTYAGTETGYYYAGDLGKSVRPFDKLVNNRGYGSYGDNSFYPMEIIFIKSLGRCKSNDNTPTPVVRSLGWCDACSYLTVAQQKVESSSSYSTLTNEYRRSSDPNQEPYKTVDICEDTGDESTCTIKHKDGVSTIKLLDYMDKKPESVYLLTSEVNDLKEGVMPILDVSDDSNWKPLKNSAISDAISQLNSRISDINDWIDILNRAKEDTLGMQPTTVHRVTKYVDPITKTEQTVDTPVSFNRDTINTQLDLILGHLYNAKNNLTSAVKDLQNAQSVSGDYQKRSTVTGALPKMQKASDELVEARKITGPCELASDSSLLDPISNIQKTYLNSLVDQITHSTNGIDDAINNLQKAIDLVKTPKTGSDPKTFASLAAQYADIVQKETYKASLNMRKLEVPTAIPDLMYSGYYKIYYSIPFMTASTPDYNMAMAKLTMGKTEAEESIDQFNAAYKTVSISNHLPDYCNSMYMVDNNNLLSGQQSELENKLSKTTFKLSWELTRLMDAIETNGPVLLLVNKINLKEVDKDLADEIKTRALIARSICGKCMVGIQIDNGPEFGTDGKLTGSGRKDLYFKTLFALNQSGGDDLFNTFDGVTFKFFPNEYVKEDSSICGSDDGIYNKTLSEIQSYGFETLKYRKFSIINEFSINSSKYPSCWATQINDDEKQSPLFKLFSRLTLHQRSLTEAGVVGLIYTGTTDLTTKTQNGALTYSEQFCSLEQAARYYVSAPAITIYQKVPFVKEAECIKCNALDLANGDCTRACGNGVDCKMPAGTTFVDSQVYKCPKNVFPSDPATPCSSFPPGTNVTCSLVYASGKIETVKFDASQLSDATPDVIASLPDQYRCSLGDSGGDYTYTKVNLQGKATAPNIFSYAADPTEDCGFPDPNLALPAQCGAVSPNMRSYSMACTFDSEPRWPLTCNMFIDCPAGMMCNYNKGPICVATPTCKSSKDCYNYSALTSCVNGYCQNKKCGIHTDCPSDAVCEPVHNTCTYSPCKKPGFPCGEMYNAMCDLSTSSKTYQQCVYRFCSPNSPCPTGTTCDYTGIPHCVDHPCKSNSECPSGQLCTAVPPKAGICADSTCKADSDCPMFYSCLDSKCRSIQCTDQATCDSSYPGTVCDFSQSICRYPKTCTSDTDCGASEACTTSPVGGKACMPRTCSMNNYFYNFDLCPVGSICDFTKKVCSVIPCTTTKDCPALSSCTNGQCTQTWCKSDNDCPSGQSCSFIQKNSETGISLFMCLDRFCSSDKDCDTGKTCDQTTKKCVAGKSCTKPSDCPVGSICDTNNGNNICASLDCSQHGDALCVQSNAFCDPITKFCKQQSCSSYNNCPSGNICSNNYCIRVACQGDGSNCATLGAFCNKTSNTCQQKSCTKSADCGSDTLCVNNKCVQQQCSANLNNCPSGSVCNFSSTFCTNSPICTANIVQYPAYQCEDSYCENGACKQKACSPQQISSCPSDTICDTTFKTCVSSPFCSRMADCTTSDLYSICADVTGPADNHCIKQSCTSSLDCLGKSTNNGYGPSGYNSLSFSLCDSATNLCKENSCRYDSDCPTGYVCDTSYQTSSDLTYPHVCQLLKTASGCPAGSGDMTISLTSGKKTICYYPLPQTSCNHNWHLVDVNIGNGKTLKYCTGDCQVGTAIDYTFNLIDANGESIKICAE